MNPPPRSWTIFVPISEKNGRSPRRFRGYFSGENAVSLILSTTKKVMTAAAMR
jgi:hypothetical protein